MVLAVETALTLHEAKCSSYSQACQGNFCIRMFSPYFLIHCFCINICEQNTLKVYSVV